MNLIVKVNSFMKVAFIVSYSSMKICLTQLSKLFKHQLPKINNLKIHHLDLSMFY